MGSIAIEEASANGASSRISCIFPTLTDGFVPDLIKCREAGRQTQHLDVGVLDQLQSTQSPPEAVIVAAWTLTIAKYIGTDEVAFYVVRTRPSAQDAMMCLLTVDESLPQRRLLAQAQDRLDSTRWYQTAIEKDASHTLPESISSEYANTVIEFADVPSVSHAEKDEGFLILHVSKSPTGMIAADLSYQHSLITDAQAAHVGQAFATVLFRLMTEPDIRICDVDYMSQVHLDRIWQFNRAVPGPWLECFHDVVERHALSRPDALAIDAWDGKFTYGGLVSLANSIASDLQDLGVRPGVIVPICFERSAWALVAMLAVSKAGGAFVSIPPNLSPGRIDAILEVIASPLMLTKSIHGHLWEGRIKWIAIEEHRPSSDAAPIALAEATDLFYVIFTSGSTGVPKGCMVSHNSWLNGALRNAPNWKYEPDGRVLQMLSHTFDMSILEICTSLGSGACVCIPTADEVEDSLAGAINRYNVTHVIMTPSLARALKPEMVPNLKTMCLGGEAFPREIVTMWSERINLIQFYGPSECSINSSYRAITSKHMDPLNIGAPNSAACWVVEANDHNKLVPIGAIGELLVSGPIVGLGYLKNPVKTAQAFLDKVDFIKDDDPVFAGFRFYKTGDLVRWNSDGTLTFCGRADTQVKLHGQRLELAEVEYHLGLDVNVQLAMALLPKVGRCRNNLVAVLTLKTTAPSPGQKGEIRLLDRRKDQSIRETIRKLFNRLQNALPRYMVPTIWAFLTSMPMSASGKIDRVQVRKWVEEMSEDTFAAVTGKSFEAVDRLEYTTGMEKEIQQIWGEVLGLSAPQVGLNQPFVALGGDSIKALVAVSKCRAKGINITVANTLACEGVEEAASLADLIATESATEQPEDESTNFDTLWDQLRDGYDLSKLGISRLEDVEDVYPCTKFQEALFLGQIRRPGSYHMRFFYKINAKNNQLPDVDTIQAAWYAVVARHPSLRTIFVEDLVSDAIYHSVVLREPSIEVEVEAIPETSASEALTKFTHSKLVPFPSRSPHHRLKILSCAGKVPYFMLEISHVIMDGSSLALFVGDFVKACTGKPLLPRGPRYRDFVAYQMKQATEEGAQYWTSYMKDCPPCLFPVTTQQTAALVPAQMRIDIGFERSAAFIARCKERHITTACAIRAAWAMVLRAYTASQDVCFGYVVSLRNAPVKDVNQMFGVTISTQPCRVQIGPDTTLVELAQNIQNDYLESVPYQHYPLTQTLQRLNHKGSQTMFNTIVSMEWIPPVDTDADSSIALEEMREQDDPAEYDIGISVDIHGDHIKLGFLHWPWVTDFETIHVANALQKAMSSFIDFPDQLVDSLSLLSANDVAATMNGLNDLHPLEALEDNVLTYIDRQAKERPDAPAIEAWDGTVSYNQLQEQSGIIARALMGRGLQRGDAVLFCMDRSCLTMIIMLGIVRSGGVFVAASPDTPRQRLQTLIRHCRPKLVIADDKYMPLFEGMTTPEGTPIDLVDAASLRGPSSLDQDHPLPSLEGHDLIYIIYTSGSTGEPKGILIEHGSLATSIVVGHGKTLPYSPEFRVLQFASLTFDIAMQEIFTTLAYGGCLCIPSEQDRLSDLAGCINRFQVSVAILTPSVARVLVPEQVPSLKILGLGGEAMSRQDLERFADVLDVYNGFGPAEATILVSFYGPMKSTDDYNNIGYAVGGTRLWVTEIDDVQRLAPIGCVGELVIESRQLARGYLHDDERTRAAFLENPPWLGPGTRVYRTGDLVRYAPDGSLRYLGRKDTQVKLRGYRIELSHIEYHINICLPQAHVVVEVITPEGESTERAMLAAFLSGVSEAEVEYISDTLTTGHGTARRVRVPVSVSEQLAHNLPSYMIPSVFFALPTMPITVNGKADRKRLRGMGAAFSALRLAENDKGQSGDEWASASDLERQVLAVWTEVLNLDARRIHLDDNFFHLGGDSITAMKLTVAAREQGILFTVPQLFRHPTIRELASLLLLQQQQQQQLPAPQPEPEPEPEPVKKSLREMLDQMNETELDDEDRLLELAAAKLMALARKKGRNLDLANMMAQIEAQEPSPAKEKSVDQDQPFSLLSEEEHIKEAVLQAAAEQCEVPPDTVEDIYAATPLQEGMISLTAKEPGAYTSVLTFELPVNVDINRFQTAWRAAAQAHPILRTRIIQVETYGILQAVLRGTPLVIEQYQADRTEALPDLTSKMGLGTPLIRLAVVRGSSESTPPRFILAMHHAMYDGWSLPLMLAQVEAAFNGENLNPQPFKPFIAYLGQSRAAAEEFWRTQLVAVDAEPFPSLPATGYQITQNTEMVQKIRLQATAKDNFTLSTKIRLAWALTVSQYTATRDIIFGVTTAGRAAPVVGIDRMLGPTIATIPVRVQVNPSQGVVSMLRAVQEDSLLCLEHEHLGLQHIRRLGPSQAAACEFQTLMVIQSAQREETSPLFGAQQILNDLGAETYPLVLICEPEAGVVNVRLKYDNEVLDPLQLTWMVNHFEHVLTQLFSEPDIPISHLEVLSPAAWRTLLAWNPPTPSLDYCVHDKIYEQSLIQPHAPAVCAWDGSLSYQQLEELSSGLANELQIGGVGPEVIVPLYFEKSRWTVIAMMAVMKAGGIFVLLDTAHPVDRLRDIVQQFQAPVLLASKERSESAQDTFGVKVITVSEEASELYRGQAHRTKSTVRPHNGIYAVFTSGSTGKPKGSISEHRAVFSSMMSVIERLHLSRESRVLQFSSFAFDVSIMEYLATFLIGGCVCIPSEFDRKNRLAEAINDLGVNWAFLTPSVVRCLSPEETPALQNIVLLGEPPNQEDYATWAPCVNLIQAYGPAECSILTTITDRIQAADNPRDIGRGSACSCWVADPQDHERLVPMGAVGELIVEGPIVNRGYLNDADKTAASFIHSPMWLTRVRDGQESRLYKTGDLVRYGPGGRVLYLGRKDTQVKLRGQRLELSEVETHLRGALPNARDVIAEVVADGDGGPPRLAVFLLAQQLDSLMGTDCSEARLLIPTQAFLSEVRAAASVLTLTLPNYMVPSLYIPVSQIPLSNSGKTDRRRLREMLKSCSRVDLQRYSLAQENTKQAPSTEKERVLQEIWARVLNLDQDSIGVHDDFFRIGGDSITGMQVATKCNSIGLPVSSADLFRHKTIAQLVAHLHTGEQVSSVPILAKEEFNTWFELSPIQQLFFDFEPDGLNHFNQTFLFRTAERLESPNVARALDWIVSHHSMLRARFRKSSDGIWTQAVMESTQGCYQFQAHQIGSKDELTAIRAASQLSLDIERGPLLAADLIDLPDGEQYLSLTAHHLAIDLVSWRILHEDMEEHLKFGSVQAAASVPFQTWCRSQAEYSAQRLPPAQALPLFVADQFDVEDYWGISKAQNTIGNVKEKSFFLDKATSEILFGIANDALSTQPPEIMQAALLHSFVQTFPSRPCARIYVEGHGREPWDPAIDLTRTVGWFTTVSPTTVQIQHTDSIIDAVRLVKDVRRQMPSRGWAYFASRYLNPHGRTAFGQQAPMEILFNYLGQYQQLERADALLQVVPNSRVSDISESMKRFALIDVSAVMSGGRLQVQFAFPRGTKHASLLDAWFKACEISLRQAVTQLASLTPRCTLSDFSLLPLTYDQLDEFMSRSLPQQGISAGEVDDIYPCSAVQRGILLSQIRDSQFYQNRILLEITSTDGSSAVDMERLKDAWQQVINRHAILRTLFLPVSHEGFVDQVVLKSSAVRNQISIIDAGQSHPPSRNALYGKNGEETVSKARPDHRVLLRRLASGAVHCEWRFNHALVDAMSLSIVRHDLLLAYEGRLPAGQGPQYRDYIEYLQQHMDREEARTYWEKYLDGVEPCFLPRLNEGSTTENETRNIRSVRIELDRGPSLNDFCKQHGITLTNLFHIAWALVLRCYIATDSVCFGYIVSGRDIPVPGAESIVGPFVNILATQVHLPSESAVLPVLSSHQENLVNSQAHRHYSLADLLHSRKLAGSSLFNTGLSVVDMTMSNNTETTAIAIEQLEAVDAAEFDVTVNIGVGEEKIGVTLHYWTSVMSESQAITMGQSFRRALEEILEHPSIRVCDVDVVGAECKTQISMWNATMPCAQDEIVHGLIHQQSQLRPDAEAVCGWDGGFTFRELDELSSRLAMHLLQLGLPPESVVPLYFEKSRWSIVAALGVLKAGSAFALLDVSHPLGRLKEICQETSSRFILSSQSNAGNSTKLASTVITVSADAVTAWPDNQTQCPPMAGMPRSPAYVIFTSGSTGKPKGVVIEHRSLSSNVVALSATLGISSTSRVLQFSSFAFDVSILEILVTLSVGGCVCVPSELERRDNLIQAMTRMKVNFASLTPAITRVFKQEEDLLTLKTLIVGGEPPSKSDPLTVHDKIQVINAYGPSECTLACVATKYVPEDPWVIGRATGCVTWIVDRHDYRKLVPIGAIGELLIEGPNVSRGYLNDPAKTAEAFVAYPTWLSQLRNGQEERLYKTGDLVQYREDGSIRFVGRKDTQIKLHGQRIELGEIEYSVRKAFPNATNVVVDIISPRKDSGRTAFLLAFILQGSNQLQPSTDESLFEAPSEQFRADIKIAETALRDALPNYMMPAGFLPLTRIPLSPSGKTDRLLLQRAAATLSQEEISSYSAAMVVKRLPVTPMESELRRIVAQVMKLPLDKIGMDDDFFRLGGDSVEAMRLVSMARQDGLLLSVVDIFEHPKISDLALAAKSRSTRRGAKRQSCSLLKTATGTDVLSEIVAGQAFHAVDVVDVLPTTEFQRDWLDMNTCTYLMLNIPGQINHEKLSTAVHELIKTHEIFRTVFVPYQQSIVQVVLRHIETQLQILEIPAEEDLPSFAEGICQRDSSTPVPCGAPHFKATLISRGNDLHALIVRLSHAQYDGLSIPVLFTDLSKAYEGLPLSISASYADYLAQRAQQRSPKALQFWRELLQDSSMTRLDPASLGGAESSENHPETAIMCIRQVSISSTPQDITIATVFKAAWSLVLAEQTGTHDLVFSQVVNGRNMALEGIEEVMGPCVNLIPVRVTIPPHWTVQALLKHLQTQHAQTLPFETLDLETIVAHCTEWLPGTRSGSVVQHQNIDLDPDLHLAGVKCAMQAHLFHHVMRDLYIESAPDKSNHNTFTIRLIASTRMLDQDHGDRLLERFCGIVQHLVAEPGRLALDIIR
ncbi:hypothetical protein CFD26_108480 [Aspergillus turcosus]|uniref:Carrier domain-containing protein n=1 Tax=Aspergillus turcosus TaxID=1245748 RepID=A0A3R7FXI6_9EURO|nr:hypothetical protein CFD26_108480 [Aspergillus turcosus]